MHATQHLRRHGALRQMPPPPLNVQLFDVSGRFRAALRVVALLAYPGKI